MVIGIDYTGSCKSNYNTITTTTLLFIIIPNYSMSKIQPRAYITKQVYLRVMAVFRQFYPYNVIDNFRHRKLYRIHLGPGGHQTINCFRENIDCISWSIFKISYSWCILARSIQTFRNFFYCSELNDKLF